MQRFLEFVWQNPLQPVFHAIHVLVDDQWSHGEHCTINPNEIPDACVANAINNSFRKHYGHGRSPKFSISIHCPRLIFPARRARIIVHLFPFFSFHPPLSGGRSKGRVKRPYDVHWISTFMHVREFPFRRYTTHEDVCFHARLLLYVAKIRWPLKQPPYVFNQKHVKANRLLFSFVRRFFYECSFCGKLQVYAYIYISFSAS